MELINIFGSKCLVRTSLKNEQLLTKVDRNQWIVQIISGNVVIQTYNKEGDLVFLRECRPLEILGSFNVNAIAEARCLSETRSVCVPRTIFIEALYKNEALVRYVLNQFYGQLIEVERRLRTAILGSVSERIVDELIQREIKLGQVLPITQSELSVRVGASRETISRELIKLEDKGIIYRNKKCYYILKRDTES